jgi:acyl dehydratase
MVGKYFDEFAVGNEYVTPSRTITETDIVMFAAMTGDYNELHTSGCWRIWVYDRIPV